MAGRVRKAAIVGTALVALAGCATRRPVLYPSPKLNEVGRAAARDDVEECVIGWE